MRTMTGAGALMTSLLILSACGSTTEQQAASGALGGAAAGAAVGGPIGAAVGAAAGGAGGSQVERVTGGEGVVEALTEDEAAGGTELEDSDLSLAEALETNPGFSTFTRLVEASGLDEELADASSVTIFAPTDDAFAALPADVTRRLDEDQDLLREVLRQHVVTGQVLPADQIPQQLQAMGGDTIRVRLADGAPVISAGSSPPDRQPSAPPADAEVAMGPGGGGAQIVNGNIAFEDGVVHGVDQVILPAGLAAGGGG